VPRDLSSAIDINNASAILRTFVKFGALSRSEHGLVFEQDERVRPVSANHLFVNLALSRKAFLKGNKALTESKGQYLQHVCQSTPDLFCPMSASAKRTTCSA
jgi:hypothetical protein